jgi:hypothetical protein
LGLSALRAPMVRHNKKTDGSKEAQGTCGKPYLEVYTFSPNCGTKAPTIINIFLFVLKIEHS